MKYKLLFIVCLITLSGLHAQDIKPPKLSAGTNLYLLKQKQHGNNPVVFSENVYRMHAQQQVYLSALIQVYPNFNQQSLDAIGAKVGTKAGNIWTVQVPLNKFNQFTKINGIKYIDLDTPMEPLLDTARRLTHVDSVHTGIYLPKKYSGEGVVVGVIDAGFDYTHPTFYDTAYQHYRVKQVWEEKTVGTPPPGFSFGAVYTDSASIITKHYDITTGTHGTHVAGIAGGSGNAGPSGNNTRYRGMAYNSDLVFTAIYPSAAHWLNTGLTDMIDGIQYIFNYANTVSKPAVANLSWGGPIGPKDGKSLFSQACNNLTGNGKIFVLSAGNNGANNIHLHKTFTPTDTIVHTFSTFSTSLVDKKNLIDIWGDSTKTFCVKFSLYSGANRIDSTAFICLNDSAYSLQMIGSTGDTIFIDIATVMEEFNGKPHALIQLFSKVTDKLCISIKSNDATINMWQGFVLETRGYYGSFTKINYAWAVNGDANMTISDMVTSQSAIGVAAYNSKPTYTNISGTTLTYTGYLKGRIASFSSKGPTADGRVKPDITGPGLALASSVSSLDSTYFSSGVNYDAVVSTDTVNGTPYSYAVAAGTSMSSPAVSGIVALMLEGNPTLNPTQVKTILKETAITDTYTGVIPVAGSTVWGFGKVNAYRAVVNANGLQGITYYSHSNLNVDLFPNPSSGNYTLNVDANSNQMLDITVTDITGTFIHQQKEMMSTGNNNFTISLQNYASGTYLIQVKTATGNAYFKAVKE